MCDKIMNQTKKVNYFYIDESGSISNNQPVFIHGCIKTDSPNSISEALDKIKSEWQNLLYYSNFKDKITKEGFHAVENNMDMKADVYKILPLLNYRSYFVITKKDSEYFKRLMNEKDESDFFALSLKKLLHDRIKSTYKDENIFYFETIKLRKTSLKQIIENLFNQYPEYDYKYKIVGKEEENLGIIDYLNYLFFHLFGQKKKDEKIMPRMLMNLDLVSPKIALINFPHKNIFLSRKKKPAFQVTLENIINLY
ncbi:hypothetical protein AAFH68_37340 [Flavobacterium sp. CGRL1]